MVPAEHTLQLGKSSIVLITVSLVAPLSNHFRLGRPRA